MGNIITDQCPYGAFILGVDMNHYPGPRKVDRHMARMALLTSVSNQDPTCLLSDTKHSWLRLAGLPDARLDTLSYRNLAEVSSQTIKINSDHRAISAEFQFI
jgi:endonuclease/exonuclease/phosphatase (EEP) superfamily protein YafD